MESQASFQRSKYLNNIPIKKLSSKIEEIKKLDLDIKVKTNKIRAVNRFAESNIPASYWDIWMDTHFTGDQRLLTKYQNYIENIEDNFNSGKSLCLCGNTGVGKSMTISNILKLAAIKNYNCLYITLSDLVTVLTTNNDEKFLVRKEINTVDFLAIDEFDPRFILSSNASDLYGSTLELVFRSRIQNKLPTLMATNSPNPLEAFSGPLKDSLKSIFNYLEMFPVLGKDHRSIK